MRPADVAAVVCTMNSISGIEKCLVSLREAGVGELVVVDAASTDGTLEVADRMADQVLADPGTGLGRARNLGVAATSLPL
ncbi:MAG: glycosyltransferase, partial [Solirubrobacterales bacterium]|nr:glycosyltransferase [Solirubrobacterales bacterium]